MNRITLLDGTFYPKIFDICWCHKCNEIVWGGHKYVVGHQNIGKPSLLIGKSPWNKGKKGLQQGWNRLKLSDGSWYPNIPITCQCNNINCNEICWNGNYIYGHNKKFEGKTHSSKTKKIMSEKAWARTSEAKKYLSEKFSGKGNPCYIDGRTKHPYCKKFNNSLKEQIRLRDSHICQHCRKTQLEEGKKLNVHHIHYDKPNCYPDLITLCNSCNSKVNKPSERNNYESFFMNKLNERGLLFWTRRMIK